MGRKCVYAVINNRKFNILSLTMIFFVFRSLFTSRLMLTQVYVMKALPSKGLKILQGVLCESDMALGDF